CARSLRAQRLAQGDPAHVLAWPKVPGRPQEKGGHCAGRVRGAAQNLQGHGARQEAPAV
ncbi:hypothetical protein GGF43_006328, partial [Coemansia sp. RSA 2618]